MGPDAAALQGGESAKQAGLVEARLLAHGDKGQEAEERDNNTSLGVARLLCGPVLITAATLPPLIQHVSLSWSALSPEGQE